jgi:hypothetical protein
MEEWGDRTRSRTRHRRASTDADREMDEVKSGWRYLPRDKGRRRQLAYLKLALLLDREFKLNTEEIQGSYTLHEIPGPIEPSIHRVSPTIILT